MLSKVHENVLTMLKMGIMDQTKFYKVILNLCQEVNLKCVGSLHFMIFTMICKLILQFSQWNAAFESLQESTAHTYLTNTADRKLLKPWVFIKDNMISPHKQIGITLQSWSPVSSIFPLRSKPRHHGLVTKDTICYTHNWCWICHTIPLSHFPPSCSLISRTDTNCFPWFP